MPIDVHNVFEITSLTNVKDKRLVTSVSCRPDISLAFAPHRPGSGLTTILFSPLSTPGLRILLDHVLLLSSNEMAVTRLVNRTTG